MGTFRSGSAVSLRSAAFAVVVVALGVYFLAHGVGQVQDSYRDMKADYESQDRPSMPNSDFPMFYTGAKTIRSSERTDTYDLHTIVRRIMLQRGFTDVPQEPPTDTDYTRWQRYYNPPFFLLALSPLTFLDLPTAYLVVTGLNLVLIVALALLMACILRWKMPESSLLALALFGFSPVYFALHHAQPTILLAVLLAAGYLALRDGHLRRAGFMFAFMSVKPQWLFPAVSALPTRPRLAVPLVVSTAVVLLAPFLLLGPNALRDYVALALGRGSDDLSNADFAGSVLSWGGFFRGITGDAEPLLWLVASIVTVAVFLVVLRYGSTERAIAAATIVCLIVVPHSHSQDWVAMLPVTAILLSTALVPSTRAMTAVLLLAVFAGANDWPSAYASLRANGEAVFWVTPAAFALLVQLAICSVTESRGRASVSREDRLVFKAPAGFVREA